MTRYRARRWGSADWIEVDVSGDDEEAEAAIAGDISSALWNTGMHVQELGEDGRWEDLA